MNQEHREPTTTENNPPRREPPANLAEQKVAPTLRGRESNCDAGCGTGNCGESGGCSTGGCGVGSLIDMVQTGFDYTDTRRIIEVEYPGARREFVDARDADMILKVRDRVVVHSERGTDFGVVSMTGSLVHAKRKAKRLSGEELPLLERKATAEDLEQFEQNVADQHEAMFKCRERVAAFHLPMDIVDSEWQYDRKRITFFFVAEGRVDFRELVRDLASIFRTRIELRQIPIRDAAKRIGGVGICGRQLCCTTHIGRYEHVTLDHARIQQLQSSPTKLSGLCGRLKCCLLYEIDNYVEGLKRFPPLDSEIRTPNGNAVVQKIDIFRDFIYLHYRETDHWEKLTLEELKAMHSKQGQKGKKEKAAENS